MQFEQDLGVIFINSIKFTYLAAIHTCHLKAIYRDNTVRLDTSFSYILSPNVLYFIGYELIELMKII